MKNKIRPLALGIIQRPDGKLLLDKGHDSVKNQTFYRPLGGGIKFGEKSNETLVREFKEEIGKDITVTELLGTVENIFEFENTPGHEIILVYKCQFTNKNDYSLEKIQGLENKKNTSVWRSIEDIKKEKALLHPKKIEEFLG